MIFSSLSFIFCLLPLFFFFDALSKNRTELRNVALIFFSLLFYTWGEGVNVLLLILLGCVNFVAGSILWDSRGTVQRIFMGLFIGFNIVCLVYFKYLFWIIIQIISFVPALEGIKIEPQVLPLGISFFTFHGISYIVDIYRKSIAEKPSLTAFLAYFFMFPHLVAGPIVRYAQIKSDLVERQPNWELFVYGMARFLIGINKKILIANSVAPIADAAFSLPVAQLSVADAWLGALAYTVQIYFDFSGYSDMAIGLAAMAGFRFEENFLAPYRSRSIKEFWRRWHISLSSWFRDYLYIPLGGSKRSALITYRNLFLVFVACGLWHGAQYTFLIWGLMHGTLLVTERIGFGKWLERMPPFIGRIYCLLMVMVGWIFFRAQDLAHAVGYVKTIIHSPNGVVNIILPIGLINAVALVAGIFIALCPLQTFLTNTSSHPKYSVVPYVLNSLFAFMSLAILYMGTRNPFIYFNF